MLGKNLENKQKEIRESRNSQNVFIGLIAGIVYSIFAWGIDAYLLTRSHYSLPWLKLLVGALPSILIILLTAWLATKLNNVVSKTVLWMIAATCLSILISFITFQGTEMAYKLLLPDVSQKISYLVPEGIRSRLVVIVIMTNILFILGGLLIDSASEAVIVSSGLFGWIFPILFCLAFFAGAGFTADSNFNTELRSNILALEEQIIEVSLLDASNLTEREERMIHRFTKLDVNLRGPRKLLIVNFDETFSQTDVLINFDGIWTQCLALNGMVGNCERLK